MLLCVIRWPPLLLLLLLNSLSHDCCWLGFVGHITMVQLLRGRCTLECCQWASHFWSVQATLRVSVLCLVYFFHSQNCLSLHMILFRDRNLLWWDQLWSVEHEAYPQGTRSCYWSGLLHNRCRDCKRYNQYLRLLWLNHALLYRKQGPHSQHCWMCTLDMTILDSQQTHIWHCSLTLTGIKHHPMHVDKWTP